MKQALESCTRRGVQPFTDDEGSSVAAGGLISVHVPHLPIYASQLGNPRARLLRQSSELPGELDCDPTGRTAPDTIPPRSQPPPRRADAVLSHSLPLLNLVAAIRFLLHNTPPTLPPKPVTTASNPALPKPSEPPRPGDRERQQIPRSGIGLPTSLRARSSTASTAVFQ